MPAELAPAGAGSCCIKGSALKALEGDTGELGEQAILKLAEALDTYIPTPERAVDGALAFRRAFIWS